MSTPIPAPTDPAEFYRIRTRLDRARVTADHFGFRDEIEGPIVGGRLLYPALGLPGPLDLCVSPAGADEFDPLISITHRASGLAVLTSFVDPDDNSARNTACWSWRMHGPGEVLSRAEYLRARGRRRYQIPLSDRGLAAGRKALRAVSGLYAWADIELGTDGLPDESTRHEFRDRLSVAVVEAVWPILTPLAKAADREELREALAATIEPGDKNYGHTSREKSRRAAVRERYAWIG